MAGRAKSKRHSCVGRQIAKQRPIDKAELVVSKAPIHAGKCRKQPDALPHKTWTLHIDSRTTWRTSKACFEASANESKRPCRVQEWFKRHIFVSS